jgi:crotonobetainyl-CoA:carnitine CoA-transferase CaiB-like acyl-CoA transferase
MTTVGVNVLDGLRVIDFGQYLAGPLVALMLAEHGADVIRVDPPGGPRWNHPVNAVLQRSKRSVVLDLHDPPDVTVARKLIDSADVVIEGFRPGVMARLGLSPEEATARNVGLIWCSLPGFGRSDPRSGLRGWEGIVSAAAGLYPPGLFEIAGEPRFSAVPMASTFAAAIAAHSIAAALLTRARSGQGDLIEVALFDAAFDAIAIYGEQPGTLSQAGFAHEQDRIANPAFGTETPYVCRDGRYIGNCGSPPRGLHRFWDAHLPVDLKSRTDEAAVSEARDALAALFARRDARDWERIMQEDFGAAVASTMTSAQWLEDEHAVSSETVTTVEDPYLGTTRQAGSVLRYGSGVPRARFPRHLVGIDSEAVRSEVSAAPVTVPDGTAPAPATRALPLAGIRVLDLTNLLAGPIAGRVLAEYGADVIKINKAAVGFGDADPLTDDPITFIGHRTTGAGKRSMYLDLKSDAGREILGDLVRTADVVHTNTSPETAERLGIDEARLRQTSPTLVYSSTRLHASGGWRAAFRGHEDLAEHVTGMSLRYGGGVPDGMHGIIVNDHATGHFAAFGIMLAILDRMRTGVGETVETSLSQTATYFQLPYMIAFSGSTWDEPSGREAMGWSASDRLFQAQDGWLWVASGDDLPVLLEKEGLAGLAGSLEAVFRSRPVAEWEALLHAHGVAAHAFRSIAQVMDDDIAIARGLSVTREHPGLGSGREVGQIVRFASRPDLTLPPATAPGWHTRQILTEMGRAAELEQLLAQRVVATHESHRQPG